MVPDPSGIEEARFHGLKSHDPDVELNVTGGMLRPPFERGPHIALTAQGRAWNVVQAYVKLALETIERLPLTAPRHGVTSRARLLRDRRDYNVRCRVSAWSRFDAGELTI